MLLIKEKATWCQLSHMGKKKKKKEYDPVRKGRFKSLKKIMPVIFMLTVFCVEVCKTTQYKL